MRVLELARSLRHVVDPHGVAARFIKVLRDAPPPLEDVAAMTHRLAHHPHLPTDSMFDEVAAHIENGFRSGRLSTVSPQSLSELADAFGHVRCESSVSALGLACLGVNPTARLSGQDLLRFIRGCLHLEAEGDPAIRSYILMRCKTSVEGLQPCDLADIAKLLAEASIYSPELSYTIQYTLSGNPWLFGTRDLPALLVHFEKWRLGPLQKKAFQSLAARLSESTELLSPAEALKTIEVYAGAGSANEVLMQHMHLRLLQDRAFVELPSAGVASLAGSMAQVTYYHTGLLREIVAHIGEDPSVVASWNEEELYQALRAFGLAPVEIPLPTLKMLGCRYNTLLWQGSSMGSIRNFFEVSANYPELLRTVLERGGGRRLASQLSSSHQQLGPRGCSDAILALAASLEREPGTDRGSQASSCACSGLFDTLGLPKTAYRDEQPDWQMRVVLKPHRTYRQSERPGKYGHYRQRVAHPDLPPNKSKLGALYLREDDGSEAASAIPNQPQEVARLGGRCVSPWALPGRKTSTSLQARQAETRSAIMELLKVLLPRLFIGLRDDSRDLGELPGAASAASLLLDAGDPYKLPKLLPSGGGVVADLPKLAQSESDMGFLPVPGESSHRQTLRTAVRESEPDPEIMRRSDLLQVCVQTLAALQLCVAPGGIASSQLLSKDNTQIMGALVPLLRHVLRPRRMDDEAIQRFHLGPQRLEAFVRRPNEEMVLEVYKTLHGQMPFLPSLTGWTLWEPRPDEILQSERTGGAILSIKREVEVPPFVVCIVIKPKIPTTPADWGTGTDF